MKSPDQIAREFIWNLVTVDCPQSNQEWNVMIGGKMLPQYQITEEIAEIHAGEVRRIIEDTIRAAVEEALYQSALPNGMTAERLAELVRISEAYRQWCVENEEHAILEQDDLCSAFLCDAVAEILLMRRVMDGPEAAAYAAGYDEGLRKGRREGFTDGADAQRRIDVDASTKERLNWTATLGDDGAHAVFAALNRAPLATPDAKEDE